MSHLTDRLERDLREVAAGAHPSPSAWESIVARLDDNTESDVAPVLAAAPDRSTRRVWLAVAATTLVVIAGSIAVLASEDGDDLSISTAESDATANPSVRPPATAADVGSTIPPTTAFLVGIWESTHTDGSSHRMDIVRSGTDEYEVVLHAATAACSSGAPASMTGTGRLETDERLVIARAELTCYDGTTPSIGPPPQAELANFTFELDIASDELVDSSGVVWRRPWQGTEPEVGAVADSPSLTMTFVSPRNGFSVKHPDRVALTPATSLWNPEVTNVGVDVVETGAAAVFRGASTEAPGFPTIDEWFDEYASLGDCGAPRRQQAEITIDGYVGRISECPNEIAATVHAGGRFYLFTLLHDRSDARAVFDALAATIDLTPQTAVDVPPLTATFVSPTNGYSFDYVDRGGLEPAKELWDPVNTPPIDEGAGSDDAFDVVETGLAAYFKSASTLIPDGVSIDEWVDEYVSPPDCRRPRSQQEAIIIDGQSGRISACPNEIHATVDVDGRLYFFTLLHDRSDARAFFDAFVATIDLTPQTAAVP